MLDEVNEKSRVRLALKAAQLYYLQDLTMDAIGDELKVSRSSVSRILQMAKDRGIVEFKIHSPEDAPRRMATEIKKTSAIIHKCHNTNRRTISLR